MMIGKIDKIIIAFMMRISRSKAWKEVKKLHGMSQEEKIVELKRQDKHVTRVSKIVMSTRVLLRMPLWFRRNAEAGVPSEIIRKFITE